MADTRILHRAAGDSEKIASLSDFEYRVWTQYVLSADDFGVMPALAFVLQADNRALRQKPTRIVQKGLEAVIASGLILAFVHQGERYVWQHDWQDWQSIRYPRATVRPLPNDVRLATPKTIKLFSEHASRVKEHFGDSAETSPIPTGAGGRETLPLTQTPTPTQRPVSERRPQFGPPLLGSPLEHRRHGWCNDRGLCLPTVLYRELHGRLGGDQAADTQLREWLASVIDGLGETVPGETVWDFWRSRFTAWQGSTTPTTKRATAPQPSADPGWFEECQEKHNGECGSRYKHGQRMAREDSAVPA
jgi:hypothetical protein